jgi:hypothetical protein
VTTYTRLTLIGPDRRADLVVPDTEPVAAVLPDILSLLEQPAGPVALVTRTGEQLDTDRSLTEQEVVDGTPLWVTALDQAPPPAQVADITDLTAHAHDTRPDAWNRQWAMTAATPVMAVLAFLASRELAQAATVSVLVGLVILACVLGRTRKASLAVLAAGAGAGLAVTTALTLPSDDPGWLIALAAFGLIAAVAALVGVIGFSDRALGVGGTVGTLVVLTLFAIIEAGASLSNAAATVAVLSVIALGIAPGVAMTASGLTGLDDRLVTGQDAARTEARITVDAAYRSLTWLTITTVVVAATCGAVTAGATAWGRPLAIAVAVVLVLRMRVLPLVPGRVALAFGALGIAVALVAGLPTPGAATTATLCLIGLVVAAVVARPSPVVVARLNRLADFAETVAMVVLVPLLLALWGVFGDLAGAFS